MSHQSLYRRQAKEVIRSKSMFKGCFQHQHLSKDVGKTNILFLNASHGPQSLVAVGTKVFLDNLYLDKSVEEVELWNDKLVQYSIEHALSKLRLLNGSGSQEDSDRFNPVLEAAESLNTVDIVVIATPMWNYSIPYVLKQYIDTIVQPGINFNDSDDPEQTENRDRILVVFSSAGAVYDTNSPIKDFLNPYLQQIFGLMGFTQFFPIFIQGTAFKQKSKSLNWTEEEAKKCAQEINKILAQKKSISTQ